MNEEAGAPTVRGDRSLTPLEMAPAVADGAAPTTTDQPALFPSPRPMFNPPSDLRSGPKRLLDLSASKPGSDMAKTVIPPPPARVATLPPEPKSQGNRPRPIAATPAMQAMPVAQGKQNPWGDENSNPEATRKGTSENPKAERTPVEQPRDSLVGLQLGEYKVIEPLGQGGMGIVYRGEQPLIGKQVAIKVLRPELASDPRQVQRLLDEARAVNAVRHPGLIDIFSFGKTPDGAQYFVMELLEGQSLEELLHARGRIKAWEAVPILEGALSALDAAHGAGVIHRDLKPSNIFMVDLPDHSHLVKLLDFGLAKMGAARGSTPQTMNVVVGTPEYMAPEQARGHEVGPRTDLYAMGIVAYELLTGDVPFTTESAVETLMLQLDAVPKSPGEIEPSIPAPLEKLVMRMLAKKPEDRPSSAAEVKRELGRIKRQLTNAETQISSLAQLREEDEAANSAMPAVTAPTPAISTQRAPAVSASRPPPPSAPKPNAAPRFETTDLMQPVDAARMIELEPRGETRRLPSKKGLPAWLLPVAALAALGLMAGVYFAFFRPVEPTIVPPPPQRALVDDKPLLPDDDLPEKPAEAAAAPDKKKTETAAPKVAGPKPAPAAAKPKARTKAEVVTRMESLQKRANESKNPTLIQLVTGTLKETRASLDKGDVTPDEAWARLDPYELQLK